MGIYVIAPFRRGEDSIFLKHGIQSQDIVRPWLKWIFENQAVFATTVSLPNLAEAKMIVQALDKKPISPEEKEYLEKLGLSIETLD